MRIEQLFKKDITRDIQGVIKIGQKDQESMHQELEEYVVTQELNKHFETFYQSYLRAFDKPTDKVGVWIAGFFGSGKSHFLKILSYLLQSDTEIDGKRPVDYFKEKLHNNPDLLNKMIEVSQHPSEVVLFNIDSKADSDSKQNKTAIVKVFNKVFNEMRGFSASIPWLAELEETIVNRGHYDRFQYYFEEETGLSWREGREELYYNFDETVAALAKATDISEDSATKWLENGETDYSISVDSFAQRIKRYIDQQPDDFRLVFAADEVGQYVSGNTQLMLNLQTVVEDLGKYCHGKVWVLVTSQQEIDSLREELSSTDFSKIQGRFNTRVSLSSANADEVIKIRLLEKKAEPFVTLTNLYDDHEVALKNKLEFEEAATMRFYRDSHDFAKVYPFIPYQFNLLQKVFTGIREHGSSGKHLSDGERNLLESIQQATIEYKDNNLDTLIPFYTFYESIDQALEHSVRSTIIKAEQNESLNDFDVSVLKLLFLIRYVDEMPGTLKNLTTLMISTLDEDTLDLSKRVGASLHKLEQEFLIQRIGNTYLFLTNEEQDVNREIGNIHIPTSEIVFEAGRRLVDDILGLKRFSYRPFQDKPQMEYLIDISQWIDDRSIRNASTDLGLRFLSVYSDFTEEPEVMALSQREESKVFIQLPERENFADLRNLLRVNQYLRTQSGQAKTPLLQEILVRKGSERKQLEDVFTQKLEQAVQDATLYVNGSIVEASGTPIKRIEEGLRVLVETIYPKITYIQKNYDREAIEKVIYSQDIELLEELTDDNHMATKEMATYLDRQHERNRMLTLHDIVSRFTKEPYGWKELDIFASLIHLIKTEKLTFTLNGRKLSPTEHDFLQTIRRQSSQEKIIVTIREVLDPVVVRKVRDYTKELFSVVSLGDKEEEIYQTIHDQFSKEQKVLERIYSYYERGVYPDRPLVREALKEMDRLLSIEESVDFLKYFAKEGELFIELFEDLEDVKDFFSPHNNKKDLYNKAQERKELYEKDRNYLNNPEIDFIMSKIDEILSMPRPYSKIKDLDELIDRFNMELGHVLDVVAHPIKEAIEQDRQDIEAELETINGYPEYDRIKRNIYLFKMNDLEQKVQQANTVKLLKSFEQESTEIKRSVFRSINDARTAILKRQEEERQSAEREKAEVGKTPEKVDNVSSTESTESSTEKIEPQKPLKEDKISILPREHLLPRKIARLKTKEDVDEYVETVRAKLMEELKETDVIQIM
ncbi:BREX system P-loop protein BrxC [Alkalibacterium iburiense]|uniref:BREX system P-loop protein BrxC n=1 Tax=Alkalibacterium iburiense TaxID=290589 RepID=A0ABP3GW13_9LACT